VSEAATAPTPRRIVFAPGLRLARIVWRILPPVALCAVVLLGVWLLQAPSAALVPVLVSTGAVVAYALLKALVTEVFSPDRPELRLVPVSDARARRLAGTLRALLFFYLVTTLGAWLVETNGWYRGVADLLRVVRSAVIVLAAWILLSSTGAIRRLRAQTGDSLRATLSRFLGRVVFPLLMVVLLFVVVTSGLGYTPLARWVARNAAFMVVEILVGVLVYRWLRRALFRTVRFYREDRKAGEGEDGASVPETDVVALGIQRIGGGILKLVVLIATFFWVFAGWNLPPGVILGGLAAPVVSGGDLTWGHVLGGVFRVVGVLMLGWFVRNLLTYFVFPRSKVGVGARYAILAVLRYTVVALAIVFALGALGVDTSSLGWFFGAAGIGIGIGLQDIIGNFISGLIMLIERPIRVGDMVTIGDASGTVENIHMRGTVLRTFDNTTVLIPNRQLLGERVTNLTHGMAHTRMLIPVGVAYGTDTERVREVLLSVARDHPKVVGEPPPNVLLQDFGASSLDFTLVCYTNELRSRVAISSELRLEVLRRLQKAGIEIPFPQTDLHIRSGLPPVG